MVRLPLPPACPAPTGVCWHHAPLIPASRAPINTHRTDTLDRYAVINVQYQHLQDALRPLLRQFAAYPRSVNQVGAVSVPQAPGRPVHAAADFLSFAPASCG